MAGVFHTGKVSMLVEVSVMDFTEIPRNPGETEHAQTVCTRLFFLHPRTRAGNKAVMSLSERECAHVQVGSYLSWHTDYVCIANRVCRPGQLHRHGLSFTLRS